MSLAPTQEDVDAVAANREQWAPSLLRKILKVQAQVESISKDGHNTQSGGYRYVSAEATIRATRDLLLENGILVLHSVQAVSDRERETKNGMTTVTDVGFLFSFFDVETGERIDLAWHGRGEDVADKGPAKAMTIALRTFLRGELLIPQGDDPEAGSSDYGQPKPKPQTTVDMSAEIEGLHPDELRHILGYFGLFREIDQSDDPVVVGMFSRIPSPFEGGVTEAIEKTKAAK